jgi:hypothetical protein
VLWEGNLAVQSAISSKVTDNAPLVKVEVVEVEAGLNVLGSNGS